MLATVDATGAALERLWDAVVIGAGPAGAIAARQLALQEKRVLLVEKARLPRDKVCGGCLGGAALDALESIGLGALPEACGAIPLRTFVLASGGTIASMPIGRRMAVSRRALDEALVNQAGRAGAAVCNQTTATIEPPSAAEFRTVALRRHGEARTVRARIVVVATGLAPCPTGHSTHVAPASRIGIGAVLRQPPIQASAGALQMACSSEGYVGVTAIERGQYDVAAAVDPHALASAKSPGALVTRILTEAGLAPTLDLQTIDWHGTPPLTRRTRPLASHRCLLIGDAAGYVEPFTGEGIGWAMQSAVLAASLLSGRLDHWDCSLPGRWQSCYYAALARHQGSCRLLSRLLRVKPFRQAAVWGLSKAPSLSRRVICRLDEPVGANGSAGPSPSRMSPPE